MSDHELIIHPPTTDEPDGSLSEFVRAIAAIVVRKLVAESAPASIQSTDHTKGAPPR